jgi:hypothetical protein
MSRAVALLSILFVVILRPVQMNNYSISVNIHSLTEKHIENESEKFGLTWFPGGGTIGLWAHRVAPEKPVAPAPGLGPTILSSAGCRCGGDTMSKDLGTSTLDDPVTKATILQAISSGGDSPFGGELEKSFSLPTSDLENPSKLLITLQTMLREEDGRHLRECGQQSPLRAFRALWHSGLFKAARQLSTELDIGIKVPSSPSSLLSAGPPMAFAEPEETGFADAEAMSVFGIWGVSEQALCIMHDVLIQGSKPNLMHWNILLTGPPGTEKLNIAQALHTLRERGRFEVLDCSDSQSEPSELLGKCVGGGTIFLKSLESASEDLGATLFQAVIPTHVTRSTFGPSRETDTTDTHFILDISDRQLPGLVSSFCRRGQWNEVRIPPLTERTSDIPQLVNHALLEFDIPTPIDEARHRFAVALWDFYEQHRPVGDIAWLRSEVGRWVRVLSPDVGLAQQDVDMTADDARAAATEPGGASTREGGQHQSDSDEFSNNPDYSSVRLRGQLYHLRGRAADVVRLLHLASLTEHEWVQRDRIADEVNFKPSKRGDNPPPFAVRDVFADRDQYQALIEGRKNGSYRLRK